MRWSDDRVREWIIEGKTNVEISQWLGQKRLTESVADKIESLRTELIYGERTISEGA